MNTRTSTHSRGHTNGHAHGPHLAHERGRPGADRGKRLPVVPSDSIAKDVMLDVDAELARFESEERARLGLETKPQWIEDMATLSFTKKDRETHHTTILVCGLTMAHDYLVEGAIRGLGYDVMHLEAPDLEALRHGKEYGNRGQCNPTYFTVGNLVKFLVTLRDKHGMSSQEIIDKYVFLTAGACGPCRFGMYVTEYRKALRDAGFPGFRVLLFQQTGGLAQATGEESAPGLDMNPKFFFGLVRALLAGDVINLLGYRVRPYEVEPGATDQALERVKKNVHQALVDGRSVLWALKSARSELAKVKVDRLRVRPKVSIIGEFWAMTTEGDGNYHLQRFLEQEGAEVDIQTVTAWILYLVWEAKSDTAARQNLRELEGGKYGLDKATGPFGVAKKLAMLHMADLAVRGVFQTFAFAAGLSRYHLCNMDRIAELAHRHYDQELRGGEGHMEVGKLLANVLDHKSHMTLSVKPFGCMPSAGVSDGVQTLVTEMHPEAIFCPVETSGDGKVNFQSRVQLYLHKAKRVAEDELTRAYTETGTSEEQVRTYLAKKPGYTHPLYKPHHVYAGSAADMVHEVSPYITKSRWQRWQDSTRALGGRLSTVGQSLSHLPAKVRANAPQLVEQLSEDLRTLWSLTRSGSSSAPSVQA